MVGVKQICSGVNSSKISLGILNKSSSPHVLGRSSIFVGVCSAGLMLQTSLVIHLPIFRHETAKNAESSDSKDGSNCDSLHVFLSKSPKSQPKTIETRRFKPHTIPSSSIKSVLAVPMGWDDENLAGFGSTSTGSVVFRSSTRVPACSTRPTPVTPRQTPVFFRSA